MLNTFKSILKWFVFITSLITAIAWWQGTEMLEILTYRTVTAMLFADQNWISKTLYCCKYVMVCKTSFTNWNAKVALLSCVYGRYLLYWIFSNGDWQTQRYFNVSTPSSCRDRNTYKKSKIICQWHAEADAGSLVHQRWMTVLV